MARKKTADNPLPKAAGNRTKLDNGKPPVMADLPPELAIKYKGHAMALLELAKRRKARDNMSFRDFIKLANQKFQFYKHSEELIKILQRVADGELERVMITVPPRHGKSFLTSQLFPAYLAYRFPDKFCAIVSYGAQLAEGFSRNARAFFVEAGGNLSPTTQAVNYWLTQEGGGIWAAGAGGTLTGRGFSSCGIIDDPIKDAEAAHSQSQTEGLREWYASTFFTRREGKAPIVVIQTRWSQADLVGWLLEKEKDTEFPEGWHLMNLPAVAEEQPEDMPKSVTLLPDWRKPGEALCPELFDEKALAAIRANVGSYWFASLYQQRPAPAEGSIFQRSWWAQHDIPNLNEFDRMVLGVDLAFEGRTKASHPSAFVVVGQKDGHFWVLDVIAKQMELPECMRTVMTLRSKWKIQAVVVEKAANGPALMQLMRKHVPGLIPRPPTGSKEQRAYAIQPIVESGNVTLPKGAYWYNDFFEEVSYFPNGAADDRVDAFVHALAYLTERQPMTSQTVMWTH